jgi:hypothetical protein
MSRDTPAHARPPGESAAGPNGTSRPASPVAQALRDLAPPRHGRTFWTDLDQRLADEPQLRLAPRSAIRPITQPPPVIDDRNLAGSLKGDRPPPRRSPRRTILAVAAALIAVLVGVAALQGPDDEDTTSTDATTETTAARTPTTEGDAAAPPETGAAPTTAPGTIDPAEPLRPGGVGVLRIGERLGDLQAAGVPIQVDTATYEGTGGTCYDAKVAGALDLTLRFRPPDGESQADDPTEGVLTSISIESTLPTMRMTDTELALGAPVDQVLAVYAGNLDESPHPFVSGGTIYRAGAGDDKGIAFFTDGLGVTRISVGEMDTIRFVNECG